MTAADRARSAGQGIQDAGGRARRSPVYRWLVTVGLVAFGVVHLLVGWIAGQLAWGRSDEKASEQGALRELAEKPLGGVLLWVVAVGMFSLVVWQAVEAAVGHQDKDGAARVGKRLSSVARAATYLAIGASAASVATGSGAGSGQRTLTARLMAVPFGRVLVAAVGLRPSCSVVPGTARRVSRWSSSACSSGGPR